MWALIEGDLKKHSCTVRPGQGKNFNFWVFDLKPVKEVCQLHVQYHILTGAKNQAVVDSQGKGCNSPKCWLKQRSDLTTIETNNTFNWNKSIPNIWPNIHFCLSATSYKSFTSCVLRMTKYNCPIMLTLDYVAVYQQWWTLGEARRGGEVTPNVG